MMGKILKIMIALLCVLVEAAMLYTGGGSGQEEEALQEMRSGGTYLDAFQFDPEELTYDGTGDLDLFTGVSLSGYDMEDLKDKIFIKIYTGNTLSEKNIQYTVETKEGIVRSIRPLKLNHYDGPSIRMPVDLPAIPRSMAGHYGEILASTGGFGVDDGFGKDVHEHAEIRYTQDATRTGMLRYTVSFENMFGDTAFWYGDVTLLSVPAYLELTESVAVIKKGEPFEASRYIARAAFADGRNAAYAVTFRGNVDTAKPGIYEVQYALEGETLVLHVKVVS